ncbi:MAG: hypothetical protein PHX18_04535 [Candidatus Gastranaerophilales bacterium]|nr:hypothetical protein [Candidatus Gastranaerophilales bacterium]
MEIFLVVLSFFLLVSITSLLMIYFYSLSQKISACTYKIALERKNIKRKLRAFQNKCRNIKAVISRIIIYNKKKRWALFFVEPLKALALTILPFGKFKKTILLFDVIRKFVVFFLPKLNR